MNESSIDDKKRQNILNYEPKVLDIEFNPNIKNSKELNNQRDFQKHKNK